MKVREKGVSVCGLNLSNGSMSCSHAVLIVVLDTSPGTHIIHVTRDRERHLYWIHPTHLILQTQIIIPPADINECVLQLDGCQHICTNNDGGYDCSCNMGFELDMDGLTCSGQL